MPEPATPGQVAFAAWQQEMNDSPLTFAQIADRIAAAWEQEDEPYA